ncbi:MULTISPECIES: GapR family DNA-binding domain-containing protein, partial [unclassified Brucella]
MSDDITSEAQTIAVGQLRAFIERIERLEEEKKTLGDDIKEVYAELKGSGFD